MTGNDVLCSAQKGFMPYDGAFENNYVFQQKLQFARRASNRELCAALIDLSNAFGSVSHSSIRRAFAASGAGNKFSKILDELLDASTILQTALGTTDPVPILQVYGKVTH